MTCQATLAVIGQHHQIKVGQQPGELVQFFKQHVATGRFLEVDTQQLLLTPHHPQLDDGRTLFIADHVGGNTGLL